ncbi:MAG TPA: hypothetical protein VEY87_00655 [Gaiellaceae bacterium]|nr:hypothetical protein [Gaiellaceae bacterium]
MRREELERRLAAAEASAEEASARLERTQKRLGEIDDERATILGETEIARRALADLGDEIARSRDALAAFEVEEARVALTEAIRRRDQVLIDAAAALNTAVDLLQEIDARRAAVTEAREQLGQVEPRSRGDRAPEEPDVLHEPWQRMVATVKAQLDEALEIDIVEAAARSNAPSALNSLPQHLRVLASERRRQLQRQALDRLDQTRSLTS